MDDYCAAIVLNFIPTESALGASEEVFSARQNP